MGVLKEKTIVYVTHQVEFLPAADLILVSKVPQKILFIHLKKLYRAFFHFLNNHRVRFHIGWRGERNILYKGG